MRSISRRFAFFGIGSLMLAMAACSGGRAPLGGGAENGAVPQTDAVGARSTGAPGASPVATASAAASPVAPGRGPRPVATPAMADWPTYMFDVERDGFNPDTAAISPSSMSKLHLAWQLATDGGGESQPVVATNIAGHTALLIFASNRTMRAIDGLTGASVWKTHLPTQDVQGCGTMGIAGTAQYDRALNEVFVASGNGASPNHVVVYAIDATTGALNGSVDATPNLVAGEGVLGHTAVTLAGGLLYVGTSSDCEDDANSPLVSWLGRLAVIDPSSMTLVRTWYSTFGQGGNDYGGGGIWSYGAIAADPSGNIYTSAGNAETDDSVVSTPPPPVVLTTDEQAGYAEHLVKLAAGATSVEDSNYPGFNFTIGQNDLDYSGTPVVFQPPPNQGCTSALTATQGKGGLLVINSTANLNPPVATYGFSVPSGTADYIGNPGYSPLTGYLYAPITSSGNGSLMLAPGMAAIGGCGKTIAWHDQFGPDSFAYGDDDTIPRSGPTVTAGGVVFMGTPCTSNGSSACGAPNPNTVGGALWAVDAATGTVLNGGTPLVVTPGTQRMPVVADGYWVWLLDGSGNLYAYTIDPAYPAVQLKAAHAVASTYHYHSPS